MAYEGKKKSVIMVTPICEAVFSKLRTPDEHGFISLIVAFDPEVEADQMFLKKVKKYCAEEVAELKRPPYWAEKDRDTGKESGRYLIKFSTKDLRKMTNADEEDVPIAPKLAKGSRVIVKTGVTNRNGWVNLWLNEVQFVKIVEPSNVGNKAAPAASKQDFEDDDIPF